MNTITFVLLTAGGVANAFAASIDGYLEYKYALQRDLLEEQERIFSGNNVQLSPDEGIVDSYMQYLKWQEFQRTRTRFLPSLPIEDVLEEIKSSKIYSVLKKFPKGGNMHLHQNHILSKTKMLDMIFNSSLLQYLCVNIEDNYAKWRLNFFATPPPKGWVHVTTNTSLYSKKELLKHTTLLNTMNSTAHAFPTNSDIRWQQLNPMFSRAGGELVTFVNYTRMHFRALFEAALEENVQYLEARATGYGMYVVNASAHSGHTLIDTSDDDLWFTDIKEELESFKAQHPEFIGYREIINGKRYTDVNTVRRDLQEAIRQRNKYPDIVGGFDLVSEEDQGYSLLFFLEDFIEMTHKKHDIPLYFHTAETNWPSDLLTSRHSNDPVSTLDNIYESIILGAKRVGHALGFIQHPYLMQVLKDRKIAVEANPVSNMLLGYVTDQRHHPALTYIKYGIPVVLGADDPGTMGYNEFTVDWYEAFMAWGLRLSDLKTLAQNSLQYSTMTDTEKPVALQKWNQSWEAFIRSLKSEACSSDLKHSAAAVYSIFPSEGAFNASTKVRVFGRNFQVSICDNIICRFGNTDVPGKYVYNSMITCQSPIPGSQASTSSFSISLNNGKTFIGTNLTFSFSHPLQINSGEVTGILIG